MFVHVMCINYCKYVLQLGDTPLHEAAYCGHTEAVDYLIGIEATVDITNSVS